MKNYEKLIRFISEREKEGIKFEFIQSQEWHHHRIELSKAILSIHGPILGIFYIFTNILIRGLLLHSLCGLIIVKTVEQKREIIGYTLGHSFKYLGWKYLVFTLIGIRDSYRKK